MPKGIPRTEEERAERHESIYGAGSTLPADRFGLGAGYTLTQVLVAFAAGVIAGFLLKGV